MKETLKPGVRGEARRRVVTEHLVSFLKPGMPPVLATPWLLDLMETAALEALRPHLDPEEVSLGVGFDFQHLAPTPAGDTVVATARVTAVDDRQITFDFEAHDSHEVIARGTHRRAVVNIELFRKRLSRKTAT
jgi:predicted thioesterase